jgi:hypothetical protein
MSQPTDLDLYSVIGFGGSVLNGLHVHPDQQNMLFPLGSTLVIKNIANQFDNSFLHGHDKGPISCVAVSRTGRYIASGQSTHMGFKVCCYSIMDCIQCIYYLYRLI